jgi:DNA-binding HxlR family transcriptional regulator
MNRRSYKQFCGLAKALDIVGERWTLLIVRNLLLGPLRYSDLMRGLPGITTNLLAKRLREMEQLDLIERVSGPGADAGHAYRLTALGAALEPAVHALGRWGWKQMSAPAKGDHRSFDFLMVALRRRYLGNATIRAELVADGTPYRVILSGPHAEIARGDVASPDVRLRGPGATLARLFLDETTRKRIPSDVSVEGSVESLRVLLDAFATSDTEIATSPAAPKARRSARA